MGEADAGKRATDEKREVQVDEGRARDTAKVQRPPEGPGEPEGVRQEGEQKARANRHQAGRERLQHEVRGRWSDGQRQGGLTRGSGRQDGAARDHDDDRRHREGAARQGHEMTTTSREGPDNHSQYRPRDAGAGERVGAEAEGQAEQCDNPQRREQGLGRNTPQGRRPRRGRGTHEQEEQRRQTTATAKACTSRTTRRKRTQTTTRRSSGGRTRGSGSSQTSTCGL